eukprot:1731707-Prymnesium_polylepis.1
MAAAASPSPAPSAAPQQHVEQQHPRAPAGAHLLRTGGRTEAAACAPLSRPTKFFKFRRPTRPATCPTTCTTT